MSKGHVLQSICNSSFFFIFFFYKEANWKSSSPTYLMAFCKCFEDYKAKIYIFQNIEKSLKKKFKRKFNNHFLWTCQSFLFIICTIAEICMSLFCFTLHIMNDFNEMGLQVGANITIFIKPIWPNLHSIFLTCIFIFLFCLLWDWFMFLNSIISNI